MGTSSESFSGAPFVKRAALLNTEFLYSANSSNGLWSFLKTWSSCSVATNGLYSNSFGIFRACKGTCNLQVTKRYLVDHKQKPEQFSERTHSPPLWFSHRRVSIWSRPLHVPTRESCDLNRPTDVTRPVTVTMPLLPDRSFLYVAKLVKTFHWKLFSVSLKSSPNVRRSSLETPQTPQTCNFDVQTIGIRSETVLKTICIDLQIIHLYPFLLLSFVLF